MTKLWNKIDAKRKLSKAIVFALSLVCAGALTNVPVFAEDTWNGLQIALNGGGTVVLQNDINAAGEDKTLTVDKYDVTLDLNGHTINGKIDASTSVGSVIKVSEGKTLTLTDSSDEKNGMITGGNTTNGGGVYVDTNSELIMNAGTISGNTTSNNGGGVYVNGGTFTMNGGTITDNKATDGGGVYVKSGKFNMTGNSVISDNSSKCGGGAYIQDSAATESAISMSGYSQIKNNAASEAYGGAYISQSSFSISENSKIEGNSAINIGGVGMANMTTLTMTGGSICNNTATNYGGVLINNSTLTMTGGRISGNKAKANYGGVHLFSGTFTLGGTAVITENTANSKPYNVGLAKGKFITLDNPSSDMSIGVTMLEPGVFTTNAADECLEYFSSDDSTYSVVYDSDKKLKLAVISASKVITAPEALSLKCNGKEQELVSAGVAQGGTMNYVLGGSSMPTEGWSSSIPTMKDAGTYTV